MNGTMYSRMLSRLVYRLKLSMSRIGSKPVSKSFFSIVDKHHGSIQQIYVINLDRQVNRWNKIQQELHRVHDKSKFSLGKIANRISAVDARNITETPNNLDIQTSYSLADQLFVEPEPLLGTDDKFSNQRIKMTRQEIAVALSHIAVWKLIASNDYPYTLVLEDDVYFRSDFAQMLDKGWTELTHNYLLLDAFDLLYVSYREAKGKVEKQQVSDVLFKPLHGLWCLSGYVLSKKGAKTLLRLLPVRGPVDLWINHQFKKLDVFATQQSVINQRLDYKSDNLYSILPILAKIGLLTKEKPLLFKTQTLPKPVFAFGRQGTGLTSLAMALSMLGYRCCSDIEELPECELNDLSNNNKSRIFDAYVNVGSLSNLGYEKLLNIYPSSKFIITVGNEEELNELNQIYTTKAVNKIPYFYDRNFNFHSIYLLYQRLLQLSANVLLLPMQKCNKWEILCEFLECQHPTSQYPTLKDKEQRNVGINNFSYTRRIFPKLRKMKFDSLPWIATPRKKWNGIPLSAAHDHVLSDKNTISLFDQFRTLDSLSWTLCDDTFPSNLALFSPRNFTIANNHIAHLTLRKEFARVREYTSASICSRRSYLYGSFSAVIRPAKVSGLVTGIFLHRNSPRQEIDIEFLGKDTTKLLVNVYYNPGDEGANNEYGYRGTPILIELGFDASKDFHRYSIEWTPTSIRWLIDGQLAFKRVNWDPTPIPHLPMQFYVNLWHSRSVELAGKLFDRNLPATSEIKSIDIQYVDVLSSLQKKGERAEL